MQKHLSESNHRALQEAERQTLGTSQAAFGPLGFDSVVMFFFCLEKPEEVRVSNMDSKMVEVVPAFFKSFFGGSSIYPAEKYFESLGEIYIYIYIWNKNVFEGCFASTDLVMTL